LNTFSEKIIYTHDTGHEAEVKTTENKSQKTQSHKATKIQTTTHKSFNSKKKKLNAKASKKELATQTVIPNLLPLYLREDA